MAGKKGKTDHLQGGCGLPASGGTSQSLVQPCTSHRSPGTTPSSPWISWHGECPNLPTQLAAIQHLRGYFSGFTDSSMTFEHREFKLAISSYVNWVNNTVNSRSTASYFMMFANGAITVKVGRLGRIAWPPMESELMVAVLNENEDVFRNNLMRDLRFKDAFHSVPLYIGKTSPLDLAGNRNYSSRANNVAPY